jgi:hypothetical protein
METSAVQGIERFIDFLVIIERKATGRPGTVRTTAQEFAGNKSHE